jgi:hypothetical protein
MIHTRLAQMHAIHSPAARDRRRRGEQHDQPPRPRDPHQPPRQAPARAGRQAVVPQHDAAARRQMRRQPLDRHAEPLVAEQPGARKRRRGTGSGTEQGVAPRHHPSYRRVAAARNAREDGIRR